MKFKVDDEVVLEILEDDLTLLKSYMPEEMLAEDLKRRVHWVISHLLEMAFLRFKEEWEPHLQKDPAISSLPKDRNEYLKMVTSKSFYKSKSQKNQEELENQKSRREAAAKERGESINPSLQAVPTSPKVIPLK